MAMLPYDINTNETYQDILLACTAFIDVATGKRLMCLVCSDGGFGKTLLAKRSFRAAKVPFVQLGATPSEYDFVQEMWRAESGITAHKGRKAVVGISDDSDGMWTRVTFLNHVKSGFGADRRLIRFPTREATKNQEYKDSEDERLKKRYRISVWPPEFDVTIRLCGLTNINYTDPSVITDPAARAHFAALVSKGLDPQWISNDPLNVFLYTHHLATAQNALGGAGFTYEVARLAVDFYVGNVHRLTDIPPRRLTQIATVIRDNPPGDERDRRLNMMLRATDQRPKLQLPHTWIPVLLWPAEPPRRPPPPDPEPQAEQVEPQQAEQVETPKPQAEQVETKPEPEPVETPKPEPQQAEEMGPEPQAEQVEAQDTQPQPTPEPTPYPGATDAILDAALPEEFVERRGAFFGALMQLRTAGAPIDDQTVAYIRETVIPDDAHTRRVFAYMTVRAIVNEARAMMTNTSGPTAPEEKPVETEHEKPVEAHLKIADAASLPFTEKDAETIGRKWDLPIMRASRSSPENRQTARLRRAFVFYLLEHEMSDEDADAAAKKVHGLGHSFWIKLTDEMTLKDVFRAAEEAKGE